VKHADDFHFDLLPGRFKSADNANHCSRITFVTCSISREGVCNANHPSCLGQATACLSLRSRAFSAALSWNFLL
jgi:hypothetical protein